MIKNIIKCHSDVRNCTTTQNYFMAGGWKPNGILGFLGIGGYNIFLIALKMTWNCASYLFLVVIIPLLSFLSSYLNFSLGNATTEYLTDMILNFTLKIVGV